MGFSQEELAERADLHRTYVSDVERGARNLSLESMTRIAHALRISVADLFPPEFPNHQTGNGGNHGQSQKLVDILLVEDNADDVELTMHAFKKVRFANRIQVAADGQEALDYLFCEGEYANRPTGRPQIVLLDLYLPKVSGLEVLRRVKADVRTHHVPVVVLTASKFDDAITVCKRLGAASFIPKPVDFQNFSAVTLQLSLQWALLKPATLAGR